MNYKRQLTDTFLGEVVRDFNTQNHIRHSG